MMRYSIEPGDRIFVKGYGFLSFAKNMGNIFVTTVRNVLVMLNNLLHMHLKLLQKEQSKKTVEETGDLIDNKITDRITKVSRTSAQNISETITNETKNI